MMEARSETDYASIPLDGGARRVLTADEWAVQQFAQVDLGDKRLTQRAVQMATLMAAHPEASLPEQMEGWAALEGRYRLLNNKQVSMEALLAPHCRQTLAAARQQPVVLMVEDTTELEYTTHKSTKGLGPVGNERGQGLLLHSTLAVVPEGRRVFPRMTVEENLRMGAFAEWRAADLAARHEHVYGLFPRLAERRNQTAATMSGGEQAMLAMGRALMSRPRLLLLDEPSLGLSPLLVEQLFEMVQTINRGGTTVFLVEQNARKTLAIAHHGFLLQKGEIVGRGTAAELAASEVVRHAYLRG